MKTEAKKLENLCPKCGGELERDGVDVGIGVMAAGPRGCPACHWVEGAPTQLEHPLITPEMRGFDDACQALLAGVDDVSAYFKPGVDGEEGCTTCPLPYTVSPASTTCQRCQYASGFDEGLSK